MVYLLIMFQIRAYSEFDKIIVFLLWDISLSIDHWLVVNMESAEHLARLAELGQCSLNMLLLMCLFLFFLEVFKETFAMIYGLSGQVVLNHYTEKSKSQSLPKSLSF